MDARSLETKIRDCLGKMHASEASMAELQTLLIQIQAERDPLAAHICASRRLVQATSLTDNTKHHRHVRHILESTLQKAGALGYRSSEHEWERLMFARPERVESKPLWEPQE